MVKTLYSVYDLTTQFYYPPIVCHNDGDAVRYFQRLVADERSIFHQHPMDFSVFSIGKFNDSDASLVQHKPEFVTNFVNLIERTKDEPSSSNNSGDS